MPRHAPARTRFLTAAGIVALHVAALFLFGRHDTRGIDAPGAIVYTQLLFPPAPKPVVPPPPPAVPDPGRRPAPPQRSAATTAMVPAPISPPAPLPETGQSAAQVPDDWATAPTTRAKVDVAALVAAAGANERARHKEPLERLRDSQRIRNSMDDSPAARAIAKTGREDCTKKYAGGANLDPLKLIPLLYDTVTDTGCKW